MEGSQRTLAKSQGGKQMTRKILLLSSVVAIMMGSFFLFSNGTRKAVVPSPPAIETNNPLNLAEKLVTISLIGLLVAIGLLAIYRMWKITRGNHDKQDKDKNGEDRKSTPINWKWVGKTAGSFVLLILLVLGGYWLYTSDQSITGRWARPQQTNRGRVGTLGWDELIATSDAWSRPTKPIPGDCDFQIHEDGDGWIKFPNGEIHEIGPMVLVNWPDIPRGSFQFKAKEGSIKVKVVWQPRR
ncbi:hypothetical protein IT398_00190 [Candidatus Nomurabacteria bacterium]|nr:hypothetical protein [Candidatus Nomurabacteria bacterium]